MDTVEAALIRQLMRMIVNAHREVEYLHRIVAGYVSLPPGASEAARQAVNPDFDALMQLIDHAPDEKLSAASA